MPTDICDLFAMEIDSKSMVAGDRAFYLDTHQNDKHQQKYENKQYISYDSPNEFIAEHQSGRRSKQQAQKQYFRHYYKNICPERKA